MIVCQCNVICSERIRSVVEEALEQMPASEVTPGHVYERCSCLPKCGGCRVLIGRIINRMAGECDAVAQAGRSRTANRAIATGAPAPSAHPVSGGCVLTDAV